jgi:predicted protein tyrosine phosphatase
MIKVKLQVTTTFLNGVELENIIKHLTDEQWEWIRLQLVNEKLHSVETYNMNVTINKGTTDVIMDAEDLIELLKYKLVALERYKAEGIDISQRVIDTQKSIMHLEEYLLSIYKDDDYPCDIVNEF